MFDDTIIYYEGDSTAAYSPNILNMGYFSYHHFPLFPKHIVIAPQDIHRQQECYDELQQIWRKADWHGGCSKHITHYTLCLKMMLRNGAFMDVRQWNSQKERIQVISISPFNTDACSISYIYPSDKKTEKDMRVVGKDYLDFRLSLSPTLTSNAKVLWDATGPSNSLPDGETIVDQCVWLHRLCQISPGAIRSNKTFLLYGAWIDEKDHFIIVGCEKGQNTLQKKEVPLDTLFEVCAPCLSTYSISKEE